ncbi:MAG: selenide, water dikinase SelD [Pseudomonadales bacterium]
MNEKLRLTEFSHGAGCGCKIAPADLEILLRTDAEAPATSGALLVGNHTRDDAAVYDLGNGTAVVSTTDFFMPIVDDPFDFGRVAATNAISDIYAMGATPLMAIAVFGWPLNKLPLEIGQRVIEGGRHVCHSAGASLAGGHSIDAPEPIFGLAVTGTVNIKHLKRNNTAQPGNKIYLTKPLGIGILTTAQKKKVLRKEHHQTAVDTMCTLNDLGVNLGQVSAVTAMTDVTGFGLAGHLLEVCESSDVNAEIDFDSLPLLPQVGYYLELGCTSGGTARNMASYGHKLGPMNQFQQQIICDPQTSGGLLVTVDENKEHDFLAACAVHGQAPQPIGRIVERRDDAFLSIV